MSAKREFLARFLREKSGYPASRGFSLVFLSVVLLFSSRFWLLAFCFGCFCAEEKTSADSPISTQSSSAHVEERDQELWGTLEQDLSLIGFSKKQ